MTRMAEVVCFDTTPLVWGVRGDADRGQEHMIERTKKFIYYLKRTQKQIMVPTPVLAEYLIGASATELNELDILRRGFILPGLDLPAAVKAAELQRGGMIRNLQDEFELDRACLKTDAEIIAIAIVGGASRIVTNNEKHFKVLARGQIPVGGVPEMPDQSTLFAE